MKTSLLALVAVAALTGCSQNELVPTDGDQVEIKLGSTVNSIEGVSGTRAPILGASPNGLLTQVLKTGTSGTYAGESYSTGTMTFTGTTASGFDTTPQFYPADGSSIFLCGLHPSTGWTVSAADGKSATYTLDGKTDVMAAAEVETVKTDAQGVNPHVKELAFKHLLTNVIVLAKTDATGATAADVQKVWGEIIGITLAKALTAAPNDEVKVALKEGTATYAVKASGVYSGKFYNASGVNYPGSSVSSPYVFTDTELAEGTKVVIPETATAVAYSMVAPITAVGNTNEDFALLVKTANHTTGVTVPVTLSAAGDTQGKYCVVTLTFKNTTILATATVADWTEGATSSGTLE